MISRSFIHNFGKLKLCHENFISIVLNVLHSPKSDFILYYIDEFKNVTIESFEINMNNIYENELQIGFDKNSSEPGKVVTLNIKSDPFSFVSICVIDKSSEVLGKPNELTNELIRNQVFEQQVTSYYGTNTRLAFIYPYGKNRVFESKGLICLNDLISLKENSMFFLLNIAIAKFLKSEL